MTLVRTLVSFSLLGLLVACGGPGDSASIPQAQPAEDTSADIGDYVVHFSAQTTDQLSPEIARAYNILRSKNRAMLNVSIIRKSDGKPVEAAVNVKTVNLTGQLKNVTMRKIDEPGESIAIYYIGETPVANRETLVFDISVTPEGESSSSDVRFKREFYTDS
ncbi:MAG: DUF4426 domain-containing protein [Woeseiaceae bacterium]